MAPFRFIKWIKEGTPITLFGDGKHTRDFTYVDDIAEGTILGAKDVGYEIINLGGGKEPISMIDFIGMIEERIGKKAEIDWQPPHSADMINTSANIDKAKQLLGWAPQTDLKDGLDLTISWYEKNLDWVSRVDLQM